MKTAARTLIVGAGEAGLMLLKEFTARKKSGEIVGFLDDDPGKQDQLLEGKKVLGPTQAITRAIKETGAEQVIIAMPSVHAQVIRRVVSQALAADANINILILPAVEKYFDAVPLSPALQRPSFADLFERQEFDLDISRINDRFSGRMIMVTGAGGSIGSELCRQLLKFDIRGLLAVGRGEHSIYKLSQSLDQYCELMPRRPMIDYRIFDIRDDILLSRAFSDFKPEVVIHAAAHKHVPLMEFNEAEAICNNVFGTLNLLEQAARISAQFVLISTDKAVRPASIMGASKRIAEMLTCRFSRDSALKTAVVRFGNVIGSRGSVIPLFRRQIERGGPLTVTDPRMKRYFMSIPEASLLAINAAASACGGEIFVLNMGREYRIVEIAEKMISWYGLKPGKDIDICFTGLRPGEKLREELCYRRGELKPTSHEKIFVLNSDFSCRQPALEEFLRLDPVQIKRLTSAEIRRLIEKLIPEFQSEPAGKNRVKGCSQRSRK